MARMASTLSACPMCETSSKDSPARRRTAACEKAHGMNPSRGSDFGGANLLASKNAFGVSNPVTGPNTVFGHTIVAGRVARPRWWRLAA